MEDASNDKERLISPDSDLQMVRRVAGSESPPPKRRKRVDSKELIRKKYKSRPQRISANSSQLTVSEPFQVASQFPCDLGPPPLAVVGSPSRDHIAMSEGSKHVFNLCNSIIGVSLLAMPFCFKKCGIILGIVMVLASGFLTRFTSHLLMKASLLCRKSNYEVLAFHAYGSLGKLTVEAGVICFMLGVLISFFVIIGDIAPAIFQELSGIESFPALRTIVLTAIGLAIGLPLGLLRNISSVGPISTLAMTFYALLTLKIIIDALPVLASDGWAESVLWWEPEGILVCMPIFSLALACQTQLFEVYDVLHEPSLGKMNKLVKQAVNICVCGYIAVGFFGYIAFYNTDFTGNILMAMQPSLVSQLIKLAFTASVVCSMPLVVFPCRTSLYSLLYRRHHTPIEIGGSRSATSEGHFRVVTTLIVVSTLIMGIMFPNIELVLELNGSTIGTIVCLIIPALLFIRVTSRNTFERTGAQVVCCIGVFILVVCTYVTLRHAAQPPKEQLKIAEHVIPEPLPDETRHQKQPLPSLGPVLPELRVKSEGPALKVVKNDQDSVKLKEVYELPKVDKPEYEKSVEKVKVVQDVRQEPPIPQDPEVIKAAKDVKEIKGVNEVNDVKEVKDERAAEKEVVKEDETKKEQVKPEEPKVVIENKPVPTAKEQVDQQKQANEQKQVDVGAKQEELLQKLQAQQEEQKELIQQQKQLLEELKAHKDTHFKDVPPSPSNEKTKHDKDKSPVLPNIVLEPGVPVKKLGENQLKVTVPVPVKNIEDRQINNEVTVGGEKLKLHPANPEIKIVPPTPLEENRAIDQKNIIPQQPLPPSIKQDKEEKNVVQHDIRKELPAPTAKQDLLVTIVRAINASNKVAAVDLPIHVAAPSVLKLGQPAEPQVVKEILKESGLKQEADARELELAVESRKDNIESGAAVPPPQSPDKHAEIRKREAVLQESVKQLPEKDDKCERSTEPPYGCQPPQENKLVQNKENLDKPVELHHAVDQNLNIRVTTNKTEKANNISVSESQQQPLKAPIQEIDSKTPSKVHSSDVGVDPLNSVVPSNIVEPEKLKLASDIPTPGHRLLAKDEQR